MKKPAIMYQLLRRVHDHEVFLSFNSDQEAAAFVEWINQGGWEAFLDFLGSGEEEGSLHLLHGYDPMRDDPCPVCEEEEGSLHLLHGYDPCPVCEEGG